MDIVPAASNSADVHGMMQHGQQVREERHAYMHMYQAGSFKIIVQSHAHDGAISFGQVLKGLAMTCRACKPEFDMGMARRG